MPTSFRILFLPAVLLFLPIAAQAVELKTTEQKFGYAVGYNFARQIQAQGVKVDDAAMAAAIQDVLQGRQLQMTPEEMKLALQAGREAMEKAAAEEAQRAFEAGEKFLVENKGKEGVVELANGLQYLVLKKGEGASPTAEDEVTVHYRGTFLNGKEFDRSPEGNPVTFRLNGVIPGFREALTRMQPGAKWQIFVPSALGYGPNGAPPAIGPNETLIFEVELVSVGSAEPK